MDKIRLENIRCYSFHGCLAEETSIGSDYRVDLEIAVDLELSSVSDELADTVDYVLLNHIVKEEMKIPSKLLEHVAKRMSDRMYREENRIKSIWIKVSKINPPINGDVEMVSIILETSRK